MSMYKKVDQKFDAALTSAEIQFEPVNPEVHSLENGVDVVYTLAPQLEKKPSPKTEADTTTKQSPWLPPDESLLVETLDDYSVVLNKYPVVRNHCLLVSKEHIPQALPLGEEDWATAIELLRTLNKESKTRHVGFFNSGVESGASVDHKHIQFVTIPEDFKPFPDTVKDTNDDEVYADNRVPFAHFIRNVPRNADADDLIFRYSQILGELLTRSFKTEFNKKTNDVHYNLVFTEEWILGVPRTKAKTDDGISINALGTIGMFLAKNESDLAIIKEKNLDLVKEVGYPFEKIEKHAPDFSGYTLY